MYDERMGPYGVAGLPDSALTDLGPDYRVDAQLREQLTQNELRAFVQQQAFHEQLIHDEMWRRQQIVQSAADIAVPLLPLPVTTPAPVVVPTPSVADQAEPTVRQQIAPLSAHYPAPVSARISRSPAVMRSVRPVPVAPVTDHTGRIYLWVCPILMSVMTIVFLLITR